MKDLGELHHFLGMHVQRRGGLLLSQRQYMLDILDRARMTECKPCSTPVDTNSKVAAAEGAPVSDATDFRSLARALQYLTFTRPDIAYAVQQVCLHMHDPREPHLAALKWILRYVQGTLHLGLLLRLILLSTPTLIGLVVPTLVDPPRVMQCSSVTISFPGLPSARIQYQDQVLKPSIAQWLTELQRRLGCDSFSWSYVPLFGAPHWCTATTSVPSTCPPIRCNISAPSTLRSIFTSSGSELLLVIFVFCMFLLLRNMQTSSPRGCLLQCSRSSGPV